MKKIKENKQLLIYLAFAVILSGLIGFYGGRYYEKSIFRKEIDDRTFTRTGNGESLGKPNGMRRPARDGLPNPNENTEEPQIAKPVTE